MSDNLSPLVGPSVPVGFSLNLEQDFILPTELRVTDDITVKKADLLRLGPNYYPMKAEVRGYCVIINNANFNNESLYRSGSKADADRLEKVFKQMGFNVESYSDLTEAEMLKKCIVISKNPKLSEHDALVVIILSHGGDDGLICGKNYEDINGVKFGFVTDKMLLRVFNDVECPLLKGKPKMFFFNCCRGKREYRAQIDSVYNDTLLSDVFVGYGTRDGCVGFRDPTEGSCFTIALATKLIQLSYDKKLQDIYKQIIEYVEELSAKFEDGRRVVRQSPIFDLYEWHKELYFNTGLNTSAVNGDSVTVEDAQKSRRTANSSVVEGTNHTVNVAKDINHIGFESTGKDGLPKLNALLEKVDTLNTHTITGSGLTVNVDNITTTGFKLS